jgi:hypothetical protein
MGRLVMVSGDYRDPVTFGALARRLAEAGAVRPVYYLAIPPALFPVVVAGLTVTLTLGAGPAEAAEYLAPSGPGRALLDTIAADTRPVAIAAVRAALAEHAGPVGVRLGAAIWVTTAVRWA